jgi:hypothetical protein
MNIKTYKTLISNLPVRQLRFTTKRSTWQKAENEHDWLTLLNNDLFQTQKKFSIGRQSIFEINGSMRKLIITTIYWGYPRGMRGNHLINILRNIDRLEQIFTELKNKNNPTTEDFFVLAEMMREIPGIHLSTYSKLLYFLGIKFNNKPSLILDRRLIDVFSNEMFDEYLALRSMRYHNAESGYVDYLNTTDSLATVLQTKGENIEYFLFIFGNNLIPVI